MSASSIYQFVYGLKQRKEAKEGLEKLGDRDYMSAEEINQRAKGLSKGFSAAERLAFFQNLTKANNAQYAKAMAFRPDMAGTILSGITYGNIGALNQFASNDAQVRRQDQNRLAGMIANQDARQMSKFIRNQEALGALGQAAQQNIIGGLRSEENDIKDVFSMIYGGGMQSNDPPQEIGTTNKTGSSYQGVPVQNQPAYQAPTYTDYGTNSYGSYQKQPAPYYGAPSTSAPAYYNDYNSYFNYK